MNKVTILSLFLVLAGFAGTAQDEDEKQIKQLSDSGEDNSIKRPSTIDVTDNIFMLKGMGGNIAVHDGIDGILMIDTQFENVSDFIAETIERKTEKKVEFIINTHFHGDHVGGNKSFSRKGATVIAHRNVRNIIVESAYAKSIKEISEKIEAEIDEVENKGNAEGKHAQMKEEIDQKTEKMVNSLVNDLDHEALPAISFDGDMLFHYNDEDIQLMHIPNAHTNSDIVVYFPKSNVLHTGDAFVNTLYPFLDTKNGGSYKGYISGLEKIASLCNKDTKIIPGHGELASVVEVQEMSRILGIYYSKIKTAYLQNNTEDQVAAMRDFTKVFDNKGYGDGFITTESFLRTLYGEVERAEGTYKRKNEEKQRKYEESQKNLKNKN